MISRPTLSCSRWWQFVYTECYVASQLVSLLVTSFLDVTSHEACGLHDISFHKSLPLLVNLLA